MSHNEAEELFHRATQAADAGETLLALRFADEAVRLEAAIPGANALRAQCLAGLGRLEEALEATKRELAANPGFPEGDLLRISIETAIAEQRAKASAERQWASIIKPDLLRPIEAATHRYLYRGHPMIKNPFDLALYPLLLWNLKPRTVFEIGSYNGASALWMADLLSTFEVESHIHSVDIAKVTAINDPRITFHEGSGRELNAEFPPEMIAKCERPFLVIEDADHTYETSIAVLGHFHPHMHEGEYFVIEDGATSEGPRLALAEFLPAHKGEYEVDSFYCDFYGYNATWCVNGFLRRM